MFIARPLNKLGKILSNAGRKLTENTGKEVEVITPDEHFMPDTSNLFSSPNIVNTNLDSKQLALVGSLYNRAKHKLENGLYDPTALTTAETALINRAQVTFSGYYEDYIFQSYSNGMIYVVGPRHMVKPSPNGGFVSIDKEYHPYKDVFLREISGYMKIKCQFPVNCLVDLAMEFDYFAALGPEITLEKMRALSKTL